MRRAVVLAALTLAIVVAPQANAFPPGVCHGTSCTGSATDSFTGVPVCQPGTATYWEDSYIPADVLNPRLAKFTVTPDPPCTGATVSAPTSDPWPASSTDPDGKPAGKSEPGKKIFRFRWTVTVPAASKTVGTMNVAWTLDWTKPAGTTETVTAGGSEAGKYDLEPQLSAPDFIEGAKAPQDIAVKVTVYNNGPAPSPALSLEAGGGLSFQGFARLEMPGGGVGTYIRALHPSRASAACHTTAIGVDCPIRALRPHGEESFAFSVRWSVAVGKATYLRAKKVKGAAAGLELRANVNNPDCRKEESNCVNNDARDETPTR